MRRCSKGSEGLYGGLGYKRKRNALSVSIEEDAESFLEVRAESDHLSMWMSDYTVSNEIWNPIYPSMLLLLEAMRESVKQLEKKMGWL